MVAYCDLSRENTSFVGLCVMPHFRAFAALRAYLNAVFSVVAVFNSFENKINEH